MHSTARHAHCSDDHFGRTCCDAASLYFGTQQESGEFVARGGHPGLVLIPFDSVVDSFGRAAMWELDDGFLQGTALVPVLAGQDTDLPSDSSDSDDNDQADEAATSVCSEQPPCQ